MIGWLTIAICSFLFFYLTDDFDIPRKERIIESLIGTCIVMFFALIYYVIVPGGMRW